VAVADYRRNTLLDFIAILALGVIVGLSARFVFRERPAKPSKPEAFPDRPTDPEAEEPKRKG